MKKTMLLSAVAAAILITTATTSCKKGDQGPAGKDGTSAGAKPTTPALAKAMVSNGLSNYTVAKGSVSLTGIDLTKLTDAKLVTQEDIDKIIAEKEALTTTTVRDAAIKAATDRKKALDLIESVKAGLSSTLGAASATSDYYASYKIESDKVTGASGNGIAFGKHFDNPAASAKQTQADLLKSLEVIKAETGSLTVTAKKIAAELAAANALKTATEAERNEAIRVAKLIKSTDVYGVVEGTPAVTVDQKAAIGIYLASKKTLVELINESKSAFGLSFEDLKITEELQKELGLTAAPAKKQ